ncbi:SUMO-interacting motif-containing protein 1 isoform X3 [Myxocyprinus asiaticus]|uniref:SUMO-interacting motif-containing protein 1 isoform X3 n=1 Tax=Myxocyprinus asiaticus TaxID=70543 RepID=UPI00222327C1|nr:SUMO-interacting motif-containing protein 1 isoform X3 [Myxocyprinus asiaticus]
MDDIIYISSGSDDDSDLEVISSYKEDAAPFIQTEWIPVKPVLINITGHKLVPPKGRCSRRDTCSTLEVIDLSDECPPDDIDVQLQNSSLALPSVDSGEKNVEYSVHVIPTAIRRAQESKSRTNNLGKDGANSGCFIGSSVQSLCRENSFTELNIQRTDVLHQDTNCNSSLSSEQLSWDNRSLGLCSSSSKSLIPFESSSVVLKNSVVDVPKDTKETQLSVTSLAACSVSANQENKGNLDSSQLWNTSVDSPYSLDSPCYCPSEVDVYIFSDESNEAEDKHHPFTMCSGQQSPQSSVHLSDIHTGSVCNPVASKDCETLNMGESEQIHKMPNTPVSPQHSSRSISTSSWASPPCSPELKSRPNQSSKRNSPTSTEILASDTVAYSHDLSTESTLSSPLSFPISLPPSPAISERAEFRRNEFDPRSFEGPSVGLWETSTSSSGDNEGVLDNVSDLSEDNTEGRQHICLAQYRKLRQSMDGTVPHMREGEDEHYGSAEPLCRQSLSLVYSTIEENYPEGTLQLLSDFIQPRYCPPVDITTHLLRGIFLDPQSSDVLAIEAYNLLMKTQREDYNSIKTLLDALNRDTKAHYHRRDWPQRTEFSVGRNNVKWEPLVDPQKVLMPPLHIKLGLMKQFVRALDKESATFKYLQDFFPKLSEAKVKAGVFVGPQIKKDFGFICCLFLTLSEQKDTFSRFLIGNRYHPVDTSTVPWDWELLMSVMEEQEDTRSLRTDIKNMLLQYVLQVLEDDFQFKHTTRRLQQSIAKTMLSCDQRFRQVRDIINWMMTAAKKSVTHSNDVEYPKKEKDNYLKIVLSLQRMLTLALEVDKTPTCSSSKLSQELFHGLNSMSPWRQLRHLLLSTMESKLLRCKLLELLLEDACSQKRPLPMSLSLLLHYLQNSSLASDPSDGAERWKKWDELLQLLWMLMLSYEEVVTGHLRCPITERFDRMRAPIWTRHDQVTPSAVRVAAEAFLCRAAADIGHALPMETQESLSQLQEHLTDVSSVISSH